jgi:hypothetical protein
VLSAAEPQEGGRRIVVVAFAAHYCFLVFLIGMQGGLFDLERTGKERKRQHRLGFNYFELSIYSILTFFFDYFFLLFFSSSSFFSLGTYGTGMYDDRSMVCSRERKKRMVRYTA